MKKYKYLSIILIITMLLIPLSGCGISKVQSGVTYSQYIYDDEARNFVLNGNTLLFNDDFSGYRMTIGEFSIMGSITENMNGYILNVSDDVLTSISGLDDLIETDPEAYKEAIEHIKKVTVNQQTYFANGMIFSHDSIVMIKDVTDKSNYSDIDGVYEYETDSSTKFRLKNGFVYKITVSNDKDSEDKTPVMRYVVQDSIIRMIRIDEDGNDVYYENKLQATSYAVGFITYPDDFSTSYANGDKSKYEKAKLLDGKTLSIFANAYYHK